MCLGLSPERLESQEILQAGMLGHPRNDVGHDFPVRCPGGESRRVNGTGWWFEENGVRGVGATWESMLCGPGRFTSTLREGLMVR